MSCGCPTEGSSAVRTDRKGGRGAACRRLAALALLLWCLPPTGVLAEDETQTLIGDGLQIALPAAALTMTVMLEDAGGRAQFATGFAAAMGLTYALKLSVDKERPNGGDMSFPSGHAAAAFNGASFIQRRYGWACGLPAYTAAAFVGYSRIQSEDHYLEDVLAGAFIGALGTYVFTRPLPEGMQVGCLIRPGSYGMSLAMRW